MQNTQQKIKTAQNIWAQVPLYQIFGIMAGVVLLTYVISMNPLFTLPWMVSLALVALIFMTGHQLYKNETFAELRASARRITQAKIAAREVMEMEFLKKVSAPEPRKGIAAIVAIISFVVTTRGLLPIMPATVVGQAMAVGVSFVSALLIYVVTVSGLSLIRYRGWPGLFAALFIVAMASPFIYFGSTTWFVSAISNQKTQEADYREQMNSLDTIVNQAIDAANADKALLPEFARLQNKWQDLAVDERENGTLTGSAGDGQVATALSSVGSNLQQTETSLSTFLKEQDKRVSAVSNQLLATKQTLLLNDPGFGTFQREAQKLRTMVSDLQGSRPLQALRSAIGSINQITVIQSSNNADLAARQAAGLNVIRQRANADILRLQVSLRTLQERSEIAVPAIINRNPIDRLQRHSSEVRMQFAMGIGVDFAFMFILFLEMFFRRRVLVKDKAPVQTAPKPTKTPKPKGPRLGVKGWLNRLINGDMPAQKLKMPNAAPVNQQSGKIEPKPSAPQANMVKEPVVETPKPQPVAKTAAPAPAKAESVQPAPQAKVVSPTVGAISQPAAKPVAKDFPENLTEALQRFARQDVAAGNLKGTALKNTEGFDLSEQANPEMVQAKAVYDKAYDEALKKAKSEAMPKKPQATTPNNVGGQNGAQHANA